MSIEETEGQKQFQKMAENIFKLSTGALALSITFRNSLAPAGTSCRWMLSLAWVCLALTVIGYILFQSQVAVVSMIYDRRNLEIDAAISGRVPAPSEADLKATEAEAQRHMHNGMKIWKFVVGAFLAGLGFFLIFAVINNV